MLFTPVIRQLLFLMSTSRPMAARAAMSCSARNGASSIVGQRRKGGVDRSYCAVGRACRTSRPVISSTDQGRWCRPLAGTFGPTWNPDALPRVGMADRSGGGDVLA